MSDDPTTTDPAADIAAELEAARAIIAGLRRTLEAVQADNAMILEALQGYKRVAKHIYTQPGEATNAVSAVEIQADRVLAAEHPGAALLAELEAWREQSARQLVVDASRIPHAALRDEIDWLLTHGGVPCSAVMALLRDIRAALSREKKFPSTESTSNG